MRNGGFVFDEGERGSCFVGRRFRICCVIWWENERKGSIIDNFWVLGVIC